MFPIEMNDLVGVARTDGYEEVVLANGAGILVLSSDDATALITAVEAELLADWLASPG